MKYNSQEFDNDFMVGGPPAQPTAPVQEKLKYTTSADEFWRVYSALTDKAYQSGALVGKTNNIKNSTLSMILSAILKVIEEQTRQQLSQQNKTFDVIKSEFDLMSSAISVLSKSFHRELPPSESTNPVPYIAGLHGLLDSFIQQLKST